MKPAPNGFGLGNHSEQRFSVFWRPFLRVARSDPWTTSRRFLTQLRPGRGPGTVFGSPRRHFLGSESGPERVLDRVRGDLGRLEPLLDHFLTTSGPLSDPVSVKVSWFYLQNGHLGPLPDHFRGRIGSSWTTSSTSTARFSKNGLRNLHFRRFLTEKSALETVLGASLGKILLWNTFLNVPEHVS